MIENVRSLYRPSMLKILLELDHYKAGISAIQEMRWIGNGLIEKRNHNIFCSYQQKNHQLGTGFIVSKRDKRTVIHFESINERLCKLRVREKFFNYIVINGYALTDKKTENENDEFYQQLKNIVRPSPRHDIKIVLGDMNTKV